MSALVEVVALLFPPAPSSPGDPSEWCTPSELPPGCRPLPKPPPAGVEVTGLLETEGPLPVAPLEVVAVFAAGDALAGALLNGFIVNRSAETTANPTSRSTE